MSENKYIYSKITRGESPSYDKFVTKDELNEVKEELLSEIDTTDTILDNHIDDKENPHEVTKAQIGLEDVVNKPMDSEVTENSENYISSGAVKTYVDANSGNINSISVNNINQPIINKNINLNVFPIDINEQYIRITDLESGIYRLKFNGTIYIYYNGYSSTDSYTIGDTQTLQVIEPVLTVIKIYNHDKDCDYWYWYLQANEFVKGFIDGDANNGTYEVDNVFTNTEKTKLANDYSRNEIDEFLQLTIDETAIDPVNSDLDNSFIVIKSEIAEKIKSFKYRLKFKSKLTNSNADDRDYFLFNPSNITYTDVTLASESAMVYSYISGLGSIAPSGSIQILSFYDLTESNLFIVGNINDNIIPSTLVASNNAIYLGDGDGGIVDTTEATFVTINNQDIIGSGNIEVVQDDNYKHITVTSTSISDGTTIISDIVSDASYIHTDNNFTTSLKDKLDGIESQANKTVVDNTLDNSSTNPVQNKVINTALDNKVDKVSGKGLSTNDFTTEYKNAVDTNTAKISNVQADWNASDGYAQILNKPSIYTQSEIDTALNTKLGKTEGIPYLTTAPTSDNIDGGLKFVVLSTDPTTKYNGYIYFITSSQNNN